MMTATYCIIKEDDEDDLTVLEVPTCVLVTMLAD